MVQVISQEDVCCPSCGNRVMVASLYFCQICKGIFCISGSQCGRGYMHGKCPRSNCALDREEFYEYTIADWLTNEPTAQSSLLSLDEWIRQQVLQNLESVRRATTLRNVLEASMEKLPFSVVPINGKVLARDPEQDIWAVWRQIALRGLGLSTSGPGANEISEFWTPLEKSNLSAVDRWNVDTLDPLKQYLLKRLSRIDSSRHPPTQSQVAVSISSAITSAIAVNSGKEQGVAVASAVDLMLQWLNESAAWSNNVIGDCGRAMDVIVTAREEAFGEFEKRRTFIEHARRIWTKIQWLLLGEIEYQWFVKNNEQALIAESKLLDWLEQFENRILFEELRLIPQDPRPSNVPNRYFLPSNSLEERSSWLNRTLSTWTADSIGLWFNEISQNGGKCSRPLSGCLDFQTAPTADDPPMIAMNLDDNSERICEKPTDDAIDSDPKDQGELSLLTVSSGDFFIRRMLPVGCAWLRALFDDEERLHWWCYLNQPKNWVKLASGASEAGAYKRLKAANIAFDRATDAVWSFQFREIPTCALTDFLNFTRALTNPDQFHHDHEALSSRQEFHRQVAVNLANLKAALPVSAQSGLQLLDWLLIVDRVSPKPQSAWEMWTTDPEQRRRIELDAISRQHLEKLSAEWDLTPLWKTQELSVDWQNVNVLFQVQGPLLAMPLAWLNFGGKPLFEQTASTSAAVSLAMRHASRQRAGTVSAVSHRLLSVQWLELKERESHCGLPLLHAAARLGAASASWEFRSLGDNPVASAGNLSESLREPYGIVVIGAHGIASNADVYTSIAGVQLANNETWCGEGVSPTNVDTVVLCSCAVGRLTQNGERDVEGLYARLAVRGARCVVAARWQIADFEAALLLGEFLKNYLRVEQQQGGMREFDRARAFNQARRTLLSSSDPLMSITPHLASAFEMYGLG